MSIALSSALIAHEDPELRRLLCRILMESAEISNAIEADCLDTAIEYLAEINDIKLFIIGLELQGMDASETIGLIREHFPSVRVVVVSSQRDSLVVLRSLAGGAHGHIDFAASANEHAETLDLVLRGRVAVPSWLPDFR